jgi:hypothetical protein
MKFLPLGSQLELEVEAVFILETRFTYWEQINCCKLI